MEYKIIIEGDVNDMSLVQMTVWRGSMVVLDMEVQMEKLRVYWIGTCI